MVGTLNTGVVTTTVYYYTIVTQGSACATDTLSGSIVVHPNTESDQVSPTQGLNQNDCDATYVNLNYGFEGISGLTITTTNTLATLGLNAVNSYTNTPSVEISIVDSATSIGEIFQIEIVEEDGGSRTRRWQSVLGNEGPNAIATALAAVINADAQVSASAVGSVITINANLNNYVFWVRVNSAGVAGTIESIDQAKIQVTNATPVKGQLSLTGTLTLGINTTTTYTLLISNINNRCDSYTTTSVLTVDPKQLISVTDTNDLALEFCDGATISSPTFVLDGGATGYSVSWSPQLPNGINFDIPAQNNIGTSTFTLVGTLNTGVTTITTYTYSITTEGTTCDISTITGTLIVKPSQGIALSAGSGDPNPTVCNAGDPITPIEYTFSGGANTYNISWTGGPIGLTVNQTSSNTLTISGTVNIPGGITATTSYTYIISTIGNSCEIGTVSGVITVIPELDYTTPLSRNQLNANAICNGDPIQNIEFSVIGGEGAANVSLTWTSGNSLNNVSVTPDATNTNWTISGLTNTVTVVTNYPYEIGIYRQGSCASPVRFSGVIQVNPSPVVDANFITLNDITAVSCNGGSDGSIIIPVSPTIEFEKRISGGQLAAQQIDAVTVSATNALSAGDVVRINIDGFNFDAVTGAGQSTQTVLQSLADQINFGANASNVAVSASVLATPELRIQADTAGIPFVTSGVTIVSGSNTTTTVISSVVSNVTINYTFAWYSNGLLVGNEASLVGVTAGEYLLDVSINSCSAATVSFTIEEPESITVSYTACEGVLSTTVSGGLAPYTVTLFDSNNAQVDQYVGNGGKRYTNLAAGAQYRLEILDSSCAVIEFLNITMPLGLDYDNTKTRIVDDYCRENPELGGGSIELDINGLAFSGGSGQFRYTWSGPNGYNNSTMNISNLLPGVYNLVVTDIQLGCTTNETFTIGGPAAALSVADSGATNPAPGLNNEISLLCNGDQVNIIVQAVGGMFNNYIYTWYRNGVQIAQGPGNSFTTTQTGAYTILAEIDFPNDPNILPAQLNSINDMYCAASTSFNVVAPTPMVVAELSDRRVIPACSNDGAQLVFEVSGGSNNVGPYTISLNNGALTGTSASREIIISNIDSNNIGIISNYTITDANGCSNDGTFSSPIALPNYSDLSFEVAPTDIDCSKSQDGSVTFSINSGAVDLSTVGIRIKSPVLNFNYFTNWANAAAGGGNPTINLPRAGSYTYEIIGTPVSGNTTSTAICDLDTGTFEIQDVSNSQIILRDINTIQPGCGVETGIIELVFDEATIPPTMSVTWEKLITSTTTSSTAQSWIPIPSESSKLTVVDLENGAYRAQINGNSGGNCGVDQITTRSIVIGNTSGLTIRNVRYEEANINNTIDNCNDVTDLRYNIKFVLENNLPSSSGGRLEVELAKISDYGEPYNQTFTAGGNNASITRPSTTDGSGAYLIADVPFGEYQMIVRQSASVTQTACETNQTIIIPEIEPFEYTGGLEFELDSCSKEVVITATVQGGVPFNVPGEPPFYSYNWTLDLGSGSVINYIGNPVTINKPGDLYLTITDSAGCVVEANEGSPIEISDEITPFSIEPALIDSDGVNVYALEPSCQNANRDDGKIQFNVQGGSINGGVGQYPYEIIWEKLDPVSGNYLLQDGTNGQFNLYMQKYADYLTPGQYKVSVTPQGWSCIGVSPYDTVGDIEYITVPQNDDLVITNGPVIDVSEYDFIDPNQLTICEPGGAGNLYVKVFNNYEGDLYFYYPTEANLVSAEQIDNDSYRIQISSSVAVGDLTVVNQEGCRITETINLQIGTPNYTYTSQNAQISGNATQTQMPLILAREEVTFNNTSSGTFSYVEWDFGDGSPIERYTPLTGSSSPVTNIYGVSGTYYPKLRLYNSVGCYEEEVKTLVVGKGYNIMVPNVFTPNGDTYNDRFKPLFSGFQSIQMTVYDYRGNMLYTEESSVDPANPLQPLALSGWDGEIRTESPYYIYAINGTTLFGAIEVLKSGTFIIIR